MARRPRNLSAAQMEVPGAHHAVQPGLRVRTGSNVVQRFGEHAHELLLQVERRPFRQHFLQLRDHQVDLQVRAHCGFLLPGKLATARTARRVLWAAQRTQTCRLRDVQPPLLGIATATCVRIFCTVAPRLFHPGGVSGKTSS